MLEVAFQEGVSSVECDTPTQRTLIEALLGLDYRASDFRYGSPSTEDRDLIEMLNNNRPRSLQTVSAVPLLPASISFSCRRGGFTLTFNDAILRQQRFFGGWMFLHLA